MNLEQKILGGLYGQALGDAFGMPAHQHPDLTYDAFGWIEDFLPGPDDHIVHFGLPAGRITDDSEQAFSLARSFIKHGGVSLEAAIEGIITWYDRVGGDASPYVGPSTKRGVQALKRGDDPKTAGLWGDTNGAPMRISPVGLLNPGDVTGAVRDAETTCIPTHNTSTAISGASAVAAAIAIAMTDEATVDAVIMAGMLGAELGKDKGRKWMGPSVARKIELGVEIGRGHGSEPHILRRIFDQVGTSLSVPETVGSAFAVFAMAEGNPAQTAIYAANLSGDADTVGAIACAIAGTYTGIDGFSAKCLEVLDADEVFAFYNVRQIAAGLQRLIEKND